MALQISYLWNRTHIKESYTVPSLVNYVHRMTVKEGVPSDYYNIGKAVSSHKNYFSSRSV